MCSRPESEDDKFFQYLPALATLAGAWSELRKGIETWTSTTPGAFAKRLDGAFAKADKSKFEWTSDFIETAGTDEPPGLARGSDWPDSLRWVPTLASSAVFGKIGVDEGAERPSRAAADLYRYVGPLVNPEVELAKGKPAQRAVALLTAPFQSDRDVNVCDGTFLAHDIVQGLLAHCWSPAFTIKPKSDMEALNDLRERVEFGKALHAEERMGEAAMGGSPSRGKCRHVLTSAFGLHCTLECDPLCPGPGLRPRRRVTRYQSRLPQQRDRPTELQGAMGAG